MDMHATGQITRRDAASTAWELSLGHQVRNRIDLQGVAAMKHGLICLVVLFVVSPLHAQQVGDTVIVVAASEAKLKMEARVVGVVPRGAEVDIEEANKGDFRSL
jgi:hypothetical protein